MGRLSLVTLRLLLLVCAALTFAPYAFAIPVFTVGGDDLCTFHDLQQAIDAATDPDGNSIFIAHDMIYSDQQVVITNQNVNLLGGYPDCSVTGTDGLTTISGTSGHSVFEIEGSGNVYMSNLEITGASMDSSHSGGGIYFGGQGSLTLVASSVFANQAGYGGGIDVSPSGPTTVNLIQTLVSLNTALVAGGGIRVEGETTLNILHTPDDTGSFITTNNAAGSDGIGYGGGIEVLGPAVANISAVVDLNTASYGGGIAALGTENGSALVTLFTGDANAPVTIYGNTATNTGGGIFLKPHSDNFATAKVCAQDFAIDANTATNGSAIYGDEDNGMGSIAFLNQAVCESPPGAVSCAPGTACNEMNGNQANNNNDQAMVLMQSGGAFAASRFRALLNAGGTLFWFVTDTDQNNGGDFMELHECLLAENGVDNVLIMGDRADQGDPGAGTQVIVDTCTVTDNQYLNDDLFHNGAVIWVLANFLEVTNSIIYDPAAREPLNFAGSAADLTTHYVLTTDISAFVGGTGIVNLAPQFVDAANGDYHLLRTSPGVDFAPEVDGIDLDGNPRTVDLTDIGNVFGPEDVGAFEIQTQLELPDEIFHDSFEP